MWHQGRGCISQAARRRQPNEQTDTAPSRCRSRRRWRPHVLACPPPPPPPPPPPHRSPTQFSPTNYSSHSACGSPVRPGAGPLLLLPPPLPSPPPPPLWCKGHVMLTEVTLHHQDVLAASVMRACWQFRRRCRCAGLGARATASWRSNTGSTLSRPIAHLRSNRVSKHPFRRASPLRSSSGSIHSRPQVGAIMAGNLTLPPPFKCPSAQTAVAL